MSTAADAVVRHTPPPGQRPAAVAGLALLAAGAVGLAGAGWRLPVLFLIGGLMGVALYHAAFGFAGAYRRAIVARDVAGARAQIPMLALAMLLFAPVLAGGEAFGRGAAGAVAPASLQVAAGSLLFGLGMQLGGGCASGTLYTAGGGSLRMVATLVAFCAGSFLGSLDLARWAGLPSLGAVSLGRSLGWPAAIAVQLAVLGLLWWGLGRWGRGRPQRPLLAAGGGRRALIAGPWPLVWAGLLLAVLNWATLVIAGHPWTITWGYTLWGAEAATALGWEPATSAFWTASFPAAALERGVFGDVISVMNLGILLGALTAAGLARRFAAGWRVAPRALLAAVLGGLLMGYGARLSFGCNIGAFFSGVASTSLHGWLWLVCAVPGTWLGIRLRPLFGLAR